MATCGTYGDLQGYINDGEYWCVDCAEKVARAEGFEFDDLGFVLGEEFTPVFSGHESGGWEYCSGCGELLDTIPIDWLDTLARELQEVAQKYAAANPEECAAECEYSDSWEVMLWFNRIGYMGMASSDYWQGGHIGGVYLLSVVDCESLDEVVRLISNELW